MKNGRIISAMLCTIIAGQTILGGAATERMVSSLEKQAARTQARKILKNININADNALEQVNNTVQQLVTDHIISEDLRPSVLEGIAAAALDLQRLPQGKGMKFAYEIIGSLVPATEQRDRFIALLGDNPSSPFFLGSSLAMFVNSLSISNAQRTELFNQILLRLVLSTNTWTARQKLSFIDGVSSVFDLNETQYNNLNNGAIKNLMALQQAPFGTLAKRDVNNHITASSIAFENTEYAQPLLHILAAAGYNGYGSLLAIATALQLGADINVVDGNGDSALMYIIKDPATPKVEFIIKQLLNLGAKIQIGSNNALLTAVRATNVTAVRELLANGGSQITRAMVDQAIQESADIITQATMEMQRYQTPEQRKNMQGFILQRQLEISTLLKLKQQQL